VDHVLDGRDLQADRVPAADVERDNPFGESAVFTPAAPEGFGPKVHLGLPSISIDTPPGLIGA